MKAVFAATILSALLIVVSTGTAERASAQTSVPFNFVLQTGCEPGNEFATRVTFTLPTPSETTAILTQQRVSGSPDAIWIDLSLFQNGFAPRTFIGAGPFQPREFFIWENVIPGRVHYYRLNALVNGRWHELGRGVFETPNCNNILHIGCEGGTASVLFQLPQFRSAPGRPLATWIDLSLFNNAFAPGTFIGAGPFAPPSNSPSLPAESFIWFGIRGGQTHYFRYNVLVEGGAWDQQTFLGFFPMDCRGLPFVPQGA